MQDELTLTLTYGSFPGFNATRAVGRAAAGVASLTVEAGTAAEGPISVEIRNVHLQAELTVTSVTSLGDDEHDGCDGDGSSIACSVATQGIGEVCESSGTCANGLRCSEGTCQPTPEFEPCIAPETERVATRATTMTFDLPIRACQRLRLDVDLPDDVEPTLAFAVIGPTRGAESLVELADDVSGDDLDFVVLLGNNAPATNTQGLDDLTTLTNRFGVPAVVHAGLRELDGAGDEAYLRRFGPHDHVWSIKGVELFSFYSATGELGPRGLSRLEAALQGLTGNALDAPLIGFTHVPPLDPNGLRDGGFRSDFEGTQVMSVLQRFGVDQLFTASAGAEDYEEMQGLELYVTSAKGTVVDPNGEYLFVRISPDGADGNVIEGRTVTVERRKIR